MNRHIVFAICSFILCSLIAAYGVCDIFYGIVVVASGRVPFAGIVLMIVFGLGAIVVPLGSVILSLAEASRHEKK